jgi:hypothetical protein
MRCLRLVLFAAAMLADAAPPASAGILITIDKSAQRMTVAVDLPTSLSMSTLPSTQAAMFRR